MVRVMVDNDTEFSRHRHCSAAYTFLRRKRNTAPVYTRITRDDRIAVLDDRIAVSSLCHCSCVILFTRTPLGVGCTLPCLPKLERGATFNLNRCICFEELTQPCF